MGDMFVSSSPILDLKASVLREHKLLILWYVLKSSCIHLYELPV
jgi:hypothetical protein